MGRDRIVVVGPDEHFLSGVSYYTARLVRALCDHGPGGDVVQLHQLCPAFIYPGRDRIGTAAPETLDHGSGGTVAKVDWHWGRGMWRALRSLWRNPPRALLVQHWTGTVLHTHLALAVVARLRRVPVVVEFHETIDVSEAERPGVAAYVRAMMRLLMTCSSGIVAHASSALRDVHRVFPSTRALPHAIIHHGPNDVYVVDDPRPVDENTRLRLLFFGVLRSYKGLEDLAEAARLLVADGEPFHLVVAGELWEEAAAAAGRLEALGEHVRFERGYLPDERLAALLGECDVVVLPYRRSVASGPLHIATAAGRTIVCSALDTLVEATAGYDGVVYARPEDPEDLARAIRSARGLAGVRHVDPNSWERNVERYVDLIDRSSTRQTGGRRVSRRGDRTVGD